MSELMLPQVEARVKEIAAFKSVQGALDLTAIQNKPIPVSPMAFVVPLSQDPGQNQHVVGGAPPLQQVSVRVAVVVAIKNLADPYGSAGNAELEGLLIALDDKLHGWVPAQDYDAIELGRAGLIAMKDYTVFFQKEYRTSTYKQGNAQ